MRLQTSRFSSVSKASVLSARWLSWSATRALTTTGHRTARAAAPRRAPAASRSTGRKFTFEPSPHRRAKAPLLAVQDVLRQVLAPARPSSVCLSTPPRTLMDAGMDAAISSSSWSSSGTRHSSDTAMLILSVSISRSSGSWVSASTANSRFSSSSDLPCHSAKAWARRSSLALAGWRCHCARAGWSRCRATSPASSCGSARRRASRRWR